MGIEKQICFRRVALRGISTYTLSCARAALRKRITMRCFAAAVLESTDLMPPLQRTLPSEITLRLLTAVKSDARILGRRMIP